MSMRLLTPPQGKSRREIENEAQELRSAQLDEAIVAKRREINDLDKSLVSSLSAIGLRNYEEEQAYREKIGRLTEEVEQLEQRRRNALVPLAEKEKQLQDKESVLLKREETVSIKESDLEYTKEILEKRLDEISEREQSASDYSKVLAGRESNVSIQEHQLQDKMSALNVIQTEMYKEIQDAKTDLANQKAILKGREVAISEREQKVAKIEAGFADREKAILDKYRTLQRAITETNLKNNVSKQNTEGNCH